MLRTRKTSILMIFLCAAALSGCTLLQPAAEQPPQVRLTLDRNYQPAIGGGFRWTVEAVNLSDDSGTLLLRVGDRVVGGSAGGLPSEIYVGWLDWKSLKFFYPDMEFPARETAVRVLMGFPEERPGGVSGWLDEPEGENVSYSGDIVLTLESPEAALMEFNIPGVRFGAADRNDGTMILRESTQPKVFDRGRSITVLFEASTVDPDSVSIKPLETKK